MSEAERRPTDEAASAALRAGPSTRVSPNLGQSLEGSDGVGFGVGTSWSTRIDGGLSNVTGRLKLPFS